MPRARIHQEVEETTVVRATGALLRQLMAVRDACATDRLAPAGCH